MAEQVRTSVLGTQALRVATCTSLSAGVPALYPDTACSACASACPGSVSSASCLDLTAFRPQRGAEVSAF